MFDWVLNTSLSIFSKHFLFLLTHSFPMHHFLTPATSKMECFVIIVNGSTPLTIITKYSILDVAAALDPPLATITLKALWRSKKIQWVIRWLFRTVLSNTSLGMAKTSLVWCLLKRCIFSVVLSATVDITLSLTNCDVTSVNTENSRISYSSFLFDVK